MRCGGAVVLGSVNLQCGVGPSVSSGGGHRMEQEGCTSGWEKNVRSFQGLVVIFRFVRSFVLFAFKISYLKLAPQMKSLGVHTMFTRLIFSWLKEKLRVSFQKGIESSLVAHLVVSFCS